MTRLSRRAAAACGLLALLFASGAGAQAPGPAVPPGPGRVLGQLVHPTRPEAAADVEVLLYALEPTGAAGIATTSSEADGSFRFEGVSNDPGVVYLIGAREADVPFGERFTFAEGELEHRVELILSEVVHDAAQTRLGAVDVRIDRGCTHLRVRQIQEITNEGEAVIFVPENLRGASPPLFEMKLPPGAVGFESLLGDESLMQEGDTVRFWGPVYPGSREIQFGYGVPLETGTLPLEFPSGATALRVLAPEGVVAASSATLESGPTEEIEGQRYASLGSDAVPRGQRVELAVSLAGDRESPLRTPRAEIWLELDDAALEVNEEIEIEVEEPGLDVSAASPWLCIFLPPEAESLRFSNETLRAGLRLDPSGALSIHGPLHPGSGALSFRYHLPARPEGAALRRSYDRELSLLHILVADRGVVAGTDRMHRRRTVRSGDRLYQYYEAFAVEASEVVELDLRRTALGGGTPRWATTGFAMLAAVAALSFLVAPLRAADAVSEAPAVEPDGLETEREAIRRSLADLDHDLETGKLSTEDHAALRAELRARAARLLLPPREAPAQLETQATPQAPPGCPSCGASLRAGDRFCARCGADLARDRDAS